MPDSDASVRVVASLVGRHVHDVLTSSDAKVRIVAEGQRIGYPLSQSWAPLPPGITSLPVAPVPVVDGTYGFVMTPTALLRPYQESVRVDSVVKISFGTRRLDYPLTLDDRTGSLVTKPRWMTVSPAQYEMKVRAAMATARTPSLEGSTPVVLAEITYSQSSVFPGNGAATLASMQNATGNETTRTGTNDTGAENWVQMDLGAIREVNNVIIGADYNNTLATGWGPTYTEDANLVYSIDGVNWWDVIAGTIGTFTSDLKTIAGLSIAARYIRIQGSGFVCVTEFYATTD